MSEENKRCPFCGGKVDRHGWLDGGGEIGPECEECGATAESIEVWNTRKHVDEALEKVKTRINLLTHMPVKPFGVEQEIGFLNKIRSILEQKEGGT